MMLFMEALLITNVGRETRKNWLWDARNISKDVYRLLRLKNSRYAEGFIVGWLLTSIKSESFQISMRAIYGCSNMKQSNAAKDSLFRRYWFNTAKSPLFNYEPMSFSWFTGLLAAIRLRRSSEFNRLEGLLLPLNLPLRSSPDWWINRWPLVLLIHFCAFSY